MASIFEKIANYLDRKGGGQQQQEPAGGSATPAEAPAPAPAKGPNAIEATRREYDAIVALLTPIYMGQADKMAQKELHLTVTNTLECSRIAHDDYLTGLKRELANRLNGMFAKITAQYQATVGADLTLITDTLYMSVVDLNEQPAAATYRAVVCACQGTTDLLRDEVVLQGPGTFNIGRGQNPMASNGMPRHNHVAINDNAESPFHEKNMTVSRAHAHIICDDKGRFMLQAEGGGLNNTSICSADGQWRTLRMPNSIYLLHDGDMIRLGKGPMLTFNILNS